MDLIFGGDAPKGGLDWWQIVARATAIYLAALLLVRLGKSRLLSRATPLDVIVTFVLGSLLSRAITGSAALSATMIAAATLVVLHWSFTKLAFSSHWWGRLIKGDSYALIRDGEIQWDNLRRSHISENDLHEELRLNANVDDPRAVKLAVKERSGEVGVVLRDESP